MTKKQKSEPTRLTDKQIKKLIRLADTMAEELYELDGLRDLSYLVTSISRLRKLRNKYMDFRADCPAGELDPWK